MRSLRAFIAGIVVPTILLPIFLFTVVVYGYPKILEYPVIHLLPVIWGVWNIFYIALRYTALPNSVNVRLPLMGGLLGFLLALYAVFGINVQESLGLAPEYYLLPLVVVPIAYAILWRALVKPLNDLLGLPEADNVPTQATEVNVVKEEPVVESPKLDSNE